MNKTSIEWCDFTANPLKFRAPDGRVVWGCEKLSAGCTNCYAEHLSTRYGGARRAGDWNAATMATLTPFLDEKEIHAMLTYKPAAGSRVFVGDMTDIFGEWVPDDLLNRLFSQVFELRQDVTWQLLTKRADRLHRYLSWRYGPDADCPRGRIPARNIWIGVSVEDQKRANERIPLLLQTPAAVRFISAEPLLWPVDLTWISLGKDDSIHALNGWHDSGYWSGRRYLPKLDWVIVGGESGGGARPFDLAWARSIVQQCQAAGVAVFVKQLGARPLFHDGCGRTSEGLRDRKGGDPSEWPVDLRVREFPRVAQEGAA